MAVNMRAPFLLARALAPAMIAQRRGKIINVSSQAGAVALDGHGAYCTSKGGAESADQGDGAGMGVRTTSRSTVWRPR
jgi:NAD(P)-dependent dehydrogenase (short-subunit alcohol dehydrogenase family)